MSVNVYDSMTGTLSPLTSAFSEMAIYDVASLPKENILDVIYRVASDNWEFVSVELFNDDMVQNTINLEEIGFATSYDGASTYTYTPSEKTIRYLHNDDSCRVARVIIDTTGRMQIYNIAEELLADGTISSGALYPFYTAGIWADLNIPLSSSNMAANTTALEAAGFTSSTDNVNYTYLPSAKRFRYNGSDVSKIVINVSGHMTITDPEDTKIYDDTIVDGTYTFQTASAVTYWIGNKAKQTAEQLAKIDDIRSFGSVSSLQDIFNSNSNQTVSGPNNKMVLKNGNAATTVTKDNVGVVAGDNAFGIDANSIELSHKESGVDTTDFRVTRTGVAMNGTLKEAFRVLLGISSTEGMIATVEPDTTATKAYVIGDLIIVNGHLYKAKAAIAIGDTITATGANPNVDEVTVEALLKLKQDKTLSTSITIDGTTETTVEGALGRLNTAKQNQNLSASITVDGTSQTTVEGALGAINALAADNKDKKQNKILDTAITVDGTQKTTVEAALNAINDLAADNKDKKQNKILDTALTIDGVSATTVEGALGTLNTKKLNVSLKGAASGLAELDANGKVPEAQLPSYVDDVIEGYLKDSTHFYLHKTVSYDAVTPVGTENPSEEGWYESDGAGGYVLTTDTAVDSGKTYYEKVETYTDEVPPESGKIYIDVETEKSYRWSGSVFVNTGSPLALGETESTAYRGDRGKIAYDTSLVNEAAIADILIDIAAQDETTATAPHAIDDLIIVENKLLKVIDDIAIGDTIGISAGNVVAISIAEALSNKLDSWTTLPTASATYLGKLVHYKGASTSTLTKGYIYECKSETDPVTGDVTYSWVPTINIVIDDELDDNSVNPVQNKVVKEAIDKKQDFIFRGTHAEWEALTTDEKAVYDLVAFTDDLCADGDAYISGSVTQGDHNAVSSDAVYQHIGDTKAYISSRDYYTDSSFLWTQASVQTLVDDMITDLGETIKEGFISVRKGIGWIGTYRYDHNSSNTHISIEFHSYIDNMNSSYHIIVNPNGIFIHEIDPIDEHYSITLPAVWQYQGRDAIITFDKHGKFVTVSCNFAWSLQSINTATTLGTVPESFRPKRDLNRFFWNTNDRITGTSVNVLSINISTLGDVTAWGYGNAGTAMNCERLWGTYITA